MARAPHPRRDEAVALLAEGQPAAQVASGLGISVRTVEGWARSISGRQRGQRGADQAQRTRALHQDGQTQQIAELLLSGETPAEIAEQLGVTPSAVRQVRARLVAV